MRIVIKDSETGIIYKLLKVLPYTTDDGFGIVLPKIHTAQYGKLELTERIYETNGMISDIREVETTQFSHDDIVKFSYHADGFTQFSSAGNNKIISGRNEDGSIRGLGVMSWPLATPVTSGPSMAMGLWGLEHFEHFSGRLDGVCVLETAKAKAHPAHPIENRSLQVYCLDIHVLRPDSRFEGMVWTVNGSEYLQYGPARAPINGIPQISGVIPLRLLRLTDSQIVLGLDWFTIGTDRKQDDEDGGFTFGGPSSFQLNFPRASARGIS